MHYVIRRKVTSTTCGLISGHIVDGHVWFGTHGADHPSKPQQNVVAQQVQMVLIQEVLRKSAQAPPARPPKSASRIHNAQ
jgi:hypothetical protein